MSPLRQIQEDAAGRILAADWFDSVAVIMQRKGETLAEIQKRIGGLTARGGKVGAAILVLMPGGGVPDQTPGPRLALKVSFVVLVNDSVNSGSTGTGLDCEEIATELLRLFNHASFGRGDCLQAGADALVPNDSFDGFVGYQVNLDLPLQLTKPSQVATPTIATAAAMSAGVAEVSTVDLVGATDFGLNEKYFTIRDANGQVYVWFDWDAQGVDPAPGGRGIRVVLPSEGNTAASIAEWVRIALAADAAFTATRTGSIVTITAAAAGVRTDIAAGTSGLAVAVQAQGTDPAPTSGWVITLACATDGAALWYTTDGSYPSSANATAHLYSASFNQATAATLRVAAEKSGLQQSNVRQLILS